MALHLVKITSSKSILHMLIHVLSKVTYTCRMDDYEERSWSTYNVTAEWCLQLTSTASVYIKTLLPLKGKHCKESIIKITDRDEIGIKQHYNTTLMFILIVCIHTIGITVLCICSFKFYCTLYTCKRVTPAIVCFTIYSVCADYFHSSQSPVRWSLSTSVCKRIILQK